MQPEPLVRPFPIAANFTLGPHALIDFSEFISPGRLNPGNWFVRFNNIWVDITTASSFGFPASQRVRLRKGLGQISVGPNVVSYNPPPFDVRSHATGNRALRFRNFPLNP